MTINEMRNYILQSYPNAGQKFRSKVVNMPTAQVIAICRSIMERSAKKKAPEQPKEEYHQMDIWEYMVQQNECEHGTGTHTEIEV